jgi:putative copper export protein
MWQELISNRSVWGVGLGRPQRSPSIEILNWGHSEWSRDGWITAHNSFLHMIYRAGVIGLGMIVLMGWTIFYLARQFLRRDSVAGIMLVATLLYWIGLANFLVVLELPYMAIPFWSLFGLTAA